MNRLLIDIFILLSGTAVLLWWSRKPLRHPGSHGFYRFFAWEGILVLFVLNHEPWGTKPFSAHQTASWILMSLSIFLVYAGHRALREQGTASGERQDGSLYEFEKTTALVTTGIFKYIRHPMYTSLLALAWGAYFQSPSQIGVGVAIVTSFLLLLTAKTDERECLAYFGESYAHYMQRTHRFIPHIY
jgi:protein-S-isoprenylcysteine O-methyltransferase Ste14